MPKIEVEGESPDIGYEIKEIVKEMLKAGTRKLYEDKKLKVVLTDDEENELKEIVEVELVIQIKASDTLLERAREDY